MKGSTSPTLRQISKETAGDPLETSTRDEITVPLAGWRVRENHTRRLITTEGVTLETLMERYEKMNLYTFGYKAIYLFFLWITSEHDLPVGKVTSKISSDEIFSVTNPQETRGGIDRPHGDHIDGRKWSDPTNGLALPIALGFHSCAGSVERQKTTECLKGNNLTK